MSRTIAAIVILVAFAAVPLIAKIFHQPYYLTFSAGSSFSPSARSALICSWDLAGLVSFGHAMFLGIGAYAVGIARYYGIENGLIQWPLGVAAAALAGLAVGAISVRLTGLYFIMITLAFGQLSISSPLG